jgi:FAD/FMN-containing dehydrogenase
VDLPCFALDDDVHASLRNEFSGQLLLPGDREYDGARRVFNAMIDRRPALIARCHGVADVIAVVRFARNHGLPIAIRGGGHSVSGHCMCEDGVVVDVSPMKGVRVNVESRRAWVQAGCTWGELDRETQIFGLAVPGGRVPETGVAGLTLGGGSGWIERKYGYTCDNLLSVELVTAEGDLIRASMQERSELFWALRGGGGNFGVVTAFEFRLHAVGPMMTAGRLMFPIDRAVELMKAYRDYMATAADEVGGACYVMCADPADEIPEPLWGGLVFLVMFSHVGAAEDGERAVAVMRDWGPMVDLVYAMSYANGVQRQLDVANLPGMRQYWKAGILDELRDAAIETFVGHASDVCSRSTTSIMHPLGGAVARVSEDETVLAHRSARWNYHILSQWEDAAESERNIAWTRAFDAAMAPFARRGLYLNYVAEPPADALEVAFGAEGCARLSAIKQEYDPDNVFRFNQNIRPRPLCRATGVRHARGAGVPASDSLDRWELDEAVFATRKVSP